MSFAFIFLYAFFHVIYRLKFVFGSCALQALDLVDQRSVTCLSSPSGRKAFQVCHIPIDTGPYMTFKTSYSEKMFKVIYHCFYPVSIFVLFFTMS